jgi:hypothetical protein
MSHSSTVTAVIRAMSLAAAILCSTDASFAAEKPARDKPQGPFAQLPGPATSHLAKLAALGDESWIELGPPAPDSKWGTAFGRSWSPKMAYAPDLHGAFLFGQGAHGGHNDENGRFMDDLWLYHAPSHSWICAYPGTDVRKPNIKINKDGIESTLDGDLVPVGTMVHGYCCVDYDTDTKQFVHMPQGDKMYQGLLAPFIKEYQSKAEGQAKNPSPWFFDIKTGKWSRYSGSNDGPPVTPSVADLIFYLPNKKLTLHHMFAGQRNLVYTYDLSTKQWKLISDGNVTREFYNRPKASTDNLAYYDTKRNRIDYLTTGSSHWVFETETMKWREGQSKDCPDAIGYVATWTYDAANDVGVLVVYRHPNPIGNGIFIYDPNKNSWTRSKNPAPAFPQNSNSYYDPELNVHFTYNARDNSPGSMWAYRYKKAEGKSKDKKKDSGKK